MSSISFVRLPQYHSHSLDTGDGFALRVKEQMRAKDEEEKRFRKMMEIYRARQPNKDIIDYEENSEEDDATRNEI